MILWFVHQLIILDQYHLVEECLKFQFKKVLRLMNLQPNFKLQVTLEVVEQDHFHLNLKELKVIHLYLLMVNWLTFQQKINGMKVLLKQLQKKIQKKTFMIQLVLLQVKMKKFTNGQVLKLNFAVLNYLVENVINKVNNQDYLMLLKENSVLV